MRWSKLKTLVEARFASSLQKRVSINSTAYGNCSCGHAWISLDKEIIANFCTRAFYNRALQDWGKMRYENKRWIGDVPVPDYVSEQQSKKYGEMEYGELSRQDAYKSCWEFVHDLSLEEALVSDDPLIQALAVLDKRLGKRRLSILSDEKFHPLSKRVLEIRKTEDGVFSVT